MAAAGARKSELPASEPPGESPQPEGAVAPRPTPRTRPRPGPAGSPSSGPRHPRLATLRPRPWMEQPSEAGASPDLEPRGRAGVTRTSSSATSDSSSAPVRDLLLERERIPPPLFPTTRSSAQGGRAGVTRTSSSATSDSSSAPVHGLLLERERFPPLLFPTTRSSAQGGRGKRKRGRPSASSRKRPSSTPSTDPSPSLEVDMGTAPASASQGHKEQPSLVEIGTESSACSSPLRRPVKPIVTWINSKGTSMRFWDSDQEVVKAYHRDLRKYREKEKRLLKLPTMKRIQHHANITQWHDLNQKNTVLNVAESVKEMYIDRMAIMQKSVESKDKWMCKLLEIEDKKAQQMVLIEQRKAEQSDRMLALEEERLQMKRERQEWQNVREEERIFAIDLSSCSLAQMEYYKDLQAEILERRRRRMRQRNDE